MVFSLDRLIATAGGGGAADIIRSFAVGVVAGDAVYQRNDGLVDKADATLVSTSEAFVGFVTAIDTPSPGQATIRFHGDLGIFGGLTVGEVYILSTSPGAVVGLSDTGNPIYPDTTPSSGHVIREVGNAGTATTLFVEASRDFEEL